MKYLISSNINYYNSTYPVIVQSLIDSGIDVSDIIMVVGGCSTIESINNPLNIQLHAVEYNSFDLTALIYISDQISDLDTHYFLLHDTCLVGNRFKQLVNQYNDSDNIKTLQSGISMNIGLYSIDSIKENIKLLQTMKFYPKTSIEFQEVKTFFVSNEDIIFKQYPNQCYHNAYTNETPDRKTIIEMRKTFNRSIYLEYFDKLEQSTIKRDIGHISNLDLYKMQANSAWGDSWKIGI